MERLTGWVYITITLFVQLTVVPLRAFKSADMAGGYSLLQLSVKIIRIIHVHRCGANGSMRACHAAGPGSMPSWDKFPG